MKRISVRSHYRRVDKKLVAKLKKVATNYGVKSPIKIADKKATQSTSLAHHSLIVDGKNPKIVKHEINLDSKKIGKSGESLQKLAMHELGHAVDAELAAKKGTFKKPTDTFSKSPAGKKYLSHCRTKKNKRQSAKELFADTFAKTHK